MGKFRANKNATKGKKQAWKKGQSSSFNPSCKKHRDEAKKRAKFGYQASGDSKLTTFALTQHNVANEDICDDGDKSVFDATSMGGLSFVSTFSNCTNPSFKRLLDRWESNSVLHKEMLAVLAAVTEVIKERGGQESETEYFAALMTTLDVVENDEARTAVLSLLSMVVRRLPEAVLKMNFNKSCPVYKELLLKYMDSEFNAMLRNLLGCLYCFLKVQEASSWNKSVFDIYGTVLDFTVHHKPKVRKSAQGIVRSLLNQKTDNVVHPAAVLTAQFCVRNLEQNAGQPSAPVYHILHLLGDNMCKFPRASLKQCCESLLKLMTLSNSMMNFSCIQAFQSMFSKSPFSDNMPDELNVRLIKALFVHQPNQKDSDTLIKWFQLMELAFINLYRLNPTMCLNHLPSFVKILMSCYLSDNEDIYPIVTSSVKNVLQSCLVSSFPQFQQLIIDDPLDNPMCKIFQMIEDSLSYQYHKAWKYTLVVVACSFESMGKYLHSTMIKCLQSLADLRGSIRFPYIVEIDAAFGAAVRTMGPKVVLSAVPLQLLEEGSKPDFPRSWLLPVLRDNIRETELAFFAQYFLPLASKLRAKVFECGKENRNVEAKTYDILCTQVWSLLPGFCTYPTDLKQSLKTVARVMGITLNEIPSLRMTVLSSLRMLISKNLDNEENKEEIAKFAKNYLPILFNLYTTESKDKSEEGVRLAVFETLKTYLQITDMELCKSLFCKALEKLQDPSIFSQHALLDLCKAMLPFVTESELSKLYVYCKPLLKHDNHTVQKKSYGVINELCSCHSDNCKTFVQQNINDLKDLLLTSLSSSSPPSKALRLSCLINIVPQLSEDNKNFIISIVPEATLCTKETAVKARTSAFSLLTAIGETLKRWHPNHSKGTLHEYLQMLLAGFTGGPHMISASILAVGHVIYTFKDELDTGLITLLIENICLLLTSNSREVVTSGLSFIKILFATVSTTDLAQHVEMLLKSIGSISQDNQRKLRFTAKELFTRLIRKFGYEMISKLAPDQFQKQLTNIRKKEKQKKNKVQTGRDESHTTSRNPKSDAIDDVLESTDDDDEEEDEDISEGNQRKRSKTTLIEECENEIVDFMDPSTSKKVLASRPTAAKKSKTLDFEMSEDGRIIISDEKKEEEENPCKRKLKVVKEEKQSCAENPQKGKKRKVEDLSDEEQDVNAKSKPILKGIHRTAKKPKLPGAAFKAKKAGGDVKRGKLEPFSYMPLNRQTLNKRKQKKLQGQFKGVVRAAKHGAMRGAKHKLKRTMKRKK